MQTKISEQHVGLYRSAPVGQDHSKLSSAARKAGAEMKLQRITGDSCLPETSGGAVNTVTLTPASGCRVGRFRIRSYFLHSVSTVANVKSCRSNGTPK